MSSTYSASPSADADLVTRAQQGDDDAFEQLVQIHAGRVHALALRLVGDRHDAEEATQEAFLRAWRSIGRFRAESEFSTWLVRIAVNEAHRVTARRSARRTATATGAAVEEQHDPGPGPADRLERSELLGALTDALDALAPAYRASIVLRDVEGLSTAEAAAAMEIGEAAFKSRLHRARLSVRRTVRFALPEGRR